jgi:hypothetical protein
VRKKIEYTVSASGKPTKIGMTITQRDSFEYEVDAMIDLDGDQATVSKSRLEAPLQMGAVVPRADLPKVLCALALGK